MENKIIDIAKYVGFAIRSNHIVIGADNLENVNKKLYLILQSKESGSHLTKISNQTAKRTNAEIFYLSNEDMQTITKSENCKVIGIKNKGLSDQIIKILRS